MNDFSHISDVNQHDNRGYYVGSNIYISNMETDNEVCNCNECNELNGRCVASKYRRYMVDKNVKRIGKGHSICSNRSRIKIK